MCDTCEWEARARAAEQEITAANRDADYWKRRAERAERLSSHWQTAAANYRKRTEQLLAQMDRRGEPVRPKPTPSASYGHGRLA